jgi:FkbM family methyltransferase
VTLDEFVDSILDEYVRLSFSPLLGGNYDAIRHSFDGVDRSRMVHVDLHAEYLRIFLRRHAEFHSTWQLLADAESRRLFVRLVLYRLLGHLHVRIREDANATSEERLFQLAAQLETGPSTLGASGLMGSLRRFDGIPAQDRSVSLECWPGAVVYTFFKRQYFYARDGIEIAPRPGDIAIDAGTCLGDTAVMFSATVGEEGRVYSFDPLPAHIAIADRNTTQNGQGNVRLVACAVGARTANLETQFHPGDAVQPGFRVEGREDVLPMVSIDDFVAMQQVPRVDFIKMDIEGAELDALRGAATTIERHRPRLAISLYHRPADFVDIPQYLAGRYPFYEFHLDHYTIHAEETVLFARPRTGSGGGPAA